MSAIDPNSREAKLIELRVLAYNRNLYVESGYYWFVNEQTLTLVKRQSQDFSQHWVLNTSLLAKELENKSSNPIVETTPATNSANTFDSQNPALWLIVVLVVFVLFKVTSNQ